MTFKLIKTLLPVTLLAMAANTLASKGEPWLTDMEQAQKAAAEQGKDIFMFFTGSDWCGWCIKLDSEVLSQQAFLDYARDNLILVDLDFPQDQELLSDEQKTHNEKWKNRFPIQGLPTVILADETANGYALTSYLPGGAEKYIDNLQTLKASKVRRDKALAKATEASGLERARLLDEALNLEGIMVDNRDALMAEIVALSKADETLHNRYATIVGNNSLMADLNSKMKPGASAQENLKVMLALFQQYGHLKEGNVLGQLVQKIATTYNTLGQRDSAIAFLDRLIADTSYSANFRQNPTGIMKVYTIAEKGDMEAATKALDQILALAPESETAQSRELILQQMKLRLPK